MTRCEFAPPTRWNEWLVYEGRCAECGCKGGRFPGCELIQTDDGNLCRDCYDDKEDSDAE